MKTFLPHGLQNTETLILPLILYDIPIPDPVTNEILINISYCDVYHSKLDETESGIPFFK